MGHVPYGIQFGEKYAQERYVYTGYMSCSNTLIRYRVWDDHSLLYRFITFIPFHIYDWVLNEIEVKFWHKCRWCGRAYFRKSDLDKCCAWEKEHLGPYRDGSRSCGCGSGGGSASYDSYNDCYRDNYGNTYTRDY